MNRSDFWVYILTSRKKTVLYTGITNDLARRVQQHKSGEGSAFTRRYNVHHLVYFEHFDTTEGAIAREKQIKGGSRSQEVKLITEQNPEWRDLSDLLEL